MAVRLRNLTPPLQTITIVRSGQTYTKSATHLQYIHLTDLEHASINPPLVPGVWEVSNDVPPDAPSEPTTDPQPVTNGNNIGTGEGFIFADRNGNVLEFRRLKAGSTNVSIITSGSDIIIDSTGGGGISLSNVPPLDVGILNTVGVGTATSREDHVHRGVLSLHADANAPLYGITQFLSGSGVTLTQVGQTITVATSGGYTTADTTLSAAQLQALNVAPIMLVPAPGAGAYNDIDSVEVSYTFVSTAYTGSGDFFVDYAANPNQNIAIDGGVLTTPSSSRRLVFPYTVIPDTVTLAVNQAIVLSTSSAFTLGNGTLKVRVRYRTLTVLT